MPARPDVSCRYRAKTGVVEAAHDRGDPLGMLSLAGAEVAMQKGSELPQAVDVPTGPRIHKGPALNHAPDGEFSWGTSDTQPRTGSISETAAGEWTVSSL